MWRCSGSYNDSGFGGRLTIRLERIAVPNPEADCRDRQKRVKAVLSQWRLRKISRIYAGSSSCRTGRPMGEVLREQLKANPANAPLLDLALPAISNLEAGKRVDTSNMPAPLMRIFNPRVQGFLISAFSYDPRQLLTGFSKPVLILQGLRDMQVGEADCQTLKGSRSSSDAGAPSRRESRAQDRQLR